MFGISGKKDDHFKQVHVSQKAKTWIVFVKEMCY